MGKYSKFTQLEKHTVQCPHCKKDVLDHMTKCPFCEAALIPAGYKPMDDDAKKRMKRITTIIGFAVAIIVVLFALINR